MEQLVGEVLDAYTEMENCNMAVFLYFFLVIFITFGGKMPLGLNPNEGDELVIDAAFLIVMLFNPARERT